MARPYLHGTYPVSYTSTGQQNRDWVRLVLNWLSDDPDDRTEVYIEPARARSLSAQLLRAADTLELR